MGETLIENGDGDWDDDFDRLIETRPAGSIRPIGTLALLELTSKNPHRGNWDAVPNVVGPLLLRGKLPPINLN